MYLHTQNNNLKYENGVRLKFLVLVVVNYEDTWISSFKIEYLRKQTVHMGESFEQKIRGRQFSPFKLHFSFDENVKKIIISS